MELRSAALHASNSLKLRSVELMISEYRKEIRELEEKKEFENMMIVLSKLKGLEDAKKHFSGLLGRVVIR